MIVVIILVVITTFTIVAIILLWPSSRSTCAHNVDVRISVMVGSTLEFSFCIYI